MKDKHGDPVKWYQAHYPKIDLAAAKRLPGEAKATLDLVWSTWNLCIESLRGSFVTRVVREQAVNQWPQLRHRDSIDAPTTTFTDSIFEIFSNLRLQFLVLTFRRRIHGAVFLPDSDIVVYDAVSTTVLVISRRSRFLQFVFPLILATWEYSVEACLGVPGPASAYRGDLLGVCEWLAIFGCVSHLALVSHGFGLGVGI